jgi:hypothetical protein
MPKYISQPKMKTKQFIPAIVFLSLFQLFSINIKPAHANPQECYSRALPSGASPDAADLVAWMCQGYTSTVTADCFYRAVPSSPSLQTVRRAAMLCKGAKSIDPGQCFYRSISSSPSDREVDRVYQLCKVDSPPEDNHNSHREERSSDGVRGVWHVKINNNWIGLLRMRGGEGNLVLVDRKDGNIVEQKIQVERDSANGYILTGNILSQSTGANNYPSDKFYVQQFSTEPMKVKDCDSSGKCYNVIFTRWSK